VKASEFIEDLRILIQERGDLEVVMDDESSALIEYNDTDGDPVFVVS
jgi:hypothetical protein